LPAKHTILIFIDEFRGKNKVQYDIMRASGFTTHWFQTSTKLQPEIDTIHILQPSFMARLMQVFSFMSKHRSTIHHIELYPGGRFAVFYLFIAKLFRIPVLCCERGDIYYYHHKKYDRVTRLSQYLIYRFADYMWLRELFAADYLTEMGIRRPYFFIHNVVPLPPENQVSDIAARDIDFLWVNSLKSFRKVSWFVEALTRPSFIHTRNVLLGLTDDGPQGEYAFVEKLPNLEVHDFIPPAVYFRRAKFFVMPASLVYLNHALLEAMSYGVVPIITEADGASLIIEHNVDGFITKFDQEAFIQGMENAMQLTPEQYQIYAANARKKIVTDYSADYYNNAIREMYSLIDQKIPSFTP
jgi:glycosyltransferase involved in cell wall biosynthesis